MDSSGINDFEKQLKKSLYRFDCPSPLELGEYSLHFLRKNLPLDIKEKIENHIKHCAHCADELKKLNPASPREPLVEKVEPLEEEHKVLLFKQEVVYHRKPVPLEGLRYGGQRAVIRKITIKMEPSEEMVMFYTLSQAEKRYLFEGQFVPEKEIEKKLTGSLVEIWQDNKIQTLGVVDDFFTFRGVLKDSSSALIRITREEGTFLSFELDLNRD